MELPVETTSYGTATLIDDRYGNGRLALQLVLMHDNPLATLTVNLPEEPLEEGEFFVKGWSENEEIIEDCRRSGLFIDTGKRVRTGFVQAEVWRLK